jgi:hypothetical protein
VAGWWKLVNISKPQTSINNTAAILLSTIVLHTHKLCASKNICDDELCPSIEYKPVKLIIVGGGGMTTI